MECEALSLKEYFQRYFWAKKTSWWKVKSHQRGLGQFSASPIPSISISQLNPKIQTDPNFPSNLIPPTFPPGLSACPRGPSSAWASASCCGYRGGAEPSLALTMENAASNFNTPLSWPHFSQDLPLENWPKVSITDLSTQIFSLHSHSDIFSHLKKKKERKKKKN